MVKAAAQPSGEVCHRCKQPIADSAKRCPSCGELHTGPRGLPIFLGILGLLALLFVAFVMVKVIRNVDIDTAPTDDTEQSAPQPPEKPPPFN